MRTAELLALIADLEVTLEQVAMDYAVDLQDPDWIDFAPVDCAILRRWSVIGLDWIKKRARTLRRTKR